MCDTSFAAAPLVPPCSRPALPFNRPSHPSQIGDHKQLRPYSLSSTLYSGTDTVLTLCPAVPLSAFPFPSYPPFPASTSLPLHLLSPPFPASPSCPRPQAARAPVLPQSHPVLWRSHCAHPIYALTCPCTRAASSLPPQIGDHKRLECRHCHGFKWLCHYAHALPFHFLAFPLPSPRRLLTTHTDR